MKLLNSKLFVARQILYVKQVIEFNLTLYHLSVFSTGNTFCRNHCDPRCMAKSCFLYKGVLAFTNLVVFFFIQIILILAILHFTDIDNLICPLNISGEI